MQLDFIWGGLPPTPYQFVIKLFVSSLTKPWSPCWPWWSLWRAVSAGLHVNNQQKEPLSYILDINTDSEYFPGELAVLKVPLNTTTINLQLSAFFPSAHDFGSPLPKLSAVLADPTQDTFHTGLSVCWWRNTETSGVQMWRDLSLQSYWTTSSVRRRGETGFTFSRWRRLGGEKKGWSESIRAALLLRGLGGGH